MREQLYHNEILGTDCEFFSEVAGKVTFINKKWIKEASCLFSNFRNVCIIKCYSKDISTKITTEVSLGSIASQEYFFQNKDVFV